MAFTRLEKDMNIIQKLEDEPNDVGGLTSAELKAKFDEGNNAMKEWINNVFIPEAEREFGNALLGQIPDRSLTAEKLAQGVVNSRNLLDNWYFVDPVNQRGQTEYSTAGYNIDRWKFSHESLCEVTENGVRLVMTAWQRWCQMFENEELLDGHTLTASVLFSDGTLSCGTIRYTYGLGDWDKHTFFKEKDLVCLITHDSGFTIYPTVECDVTIKAVKLELGSVQTLAHQDENGAWVLNDLPNKQQELAKCQRYQFVMPRLRFKYDNSANVGDVFLPLMFPTAMRITPTITHDAANGVSVVSDFDTTHALLQISSSAFIDNTLTNIIFDANL